MDLLTTTTGGRAVLVVALLGVVSLAWWLRARRSGTVRAARASAPPVDAELLGALQTAGVTLGARATFVQLSSEVCTPCRRTATILSRLVDETSGVNHVELDAAQHPDLVRSLRVLRTPTVLVLDGDGRERGRSSGGMTPVQARAALEVVPGFAGEPSPSEPASVPGPVPTAPTAGATATATAPERGTVALRHLDETRRP